MRDLYSQNDEALRALVHHAPLDVPKDAATFVNIHQVDYDGAENNIAMRASHGHVKIPC